ncbi:MAG: carbohydrate kinase family protein [Chloroflexi bacterium]|nr:carbohydrate kinase family protein [Chloroflexota bacterium]
MTHTYDYDAVVAGHLCLDILPQLAGIPAGEFMRLFAPGRLVEVGPASLMTGGPVSNTGLALHKLGIATRLMGKVGADLFGQAVVQIVGSFGPGLADGMVVDPAVSTSYTILVNPPGVDRMFLHCPGANDAFGAADVRYDVVAGGRLFHFGYPPLMRLMYSDGGDQLSAIFRQAKATGVTTSLDMAFPDPTSAAGRADWPKIARATLPYVDVFLPSIEEILLMLRRPVYDALLRAAAGGDILPLVTSDLLADLGDELLALGAKIVALKLGYRGLYLRTAGRAALAGMGRARPTAVAAWADRELWTPCFQVDVVGTAGSGDATIAGFLAALLRDLPPEEAITMAVAVGACNVEAADTLSGIRSWDETLRRVAAGWPKRNDGY